MAKEIFRQEDIDRYENLSGYAWCEKWAIIDVEKDKEVEHISIPIAEFFIVLNEKRPEYKKYLPYRVRVHKLDRGDNPYLQETMYCGLEHEDGSLDLYLDHEAEHSTVSLLWILFHEFRHKIQSKNSNVGMAAGGNASTKMWESQYKGDRWNEFCHVFHEISPQDVDANVFACELLEIDYPGSKFELTEDRLKEFLKND